MGNSLRWYRRTVALSSDFLSYLRAFRRLRFYVESRIISLNDVVRMLFRDGETPPGVVEQWCIDHCRGRYQQVEAGLWGFSDQRDADRFRTAWTRRDAPVSPPVLRVIDGDRSDDR